MQRGKKYKNISGKVRKKCKGCMGFYKTYSSQIKHRGSKFCSMSCKRKYRSESVTNIKSKIWELCKTIIRKKYPNNCYTCGQTNLSAGNWHTGHFVSKSLCNSKMKFDLRNLRPQCYRCNINGGGAGAIFYKLMVEREGQEYVDGIFKDNEGHQQMKLQDWIDLKESLEKQLEELR